ncbi:ankyrin-1-like isoform X2 [Mytilus californianus]|nr:ankyrin-1-like isoform X2 [Mytilus californianus]XP_052092783.1 ankyrin-1-like isoform X2 [Mytilus californianus]
MAVGSSGCGKSTSIHYVALSLYQKQGYEVIHVYSPEEIRQYYNPECKQVIVFDDLCGKSTIDFNLVNNWSRLLNDIIRILEDTNIKMLSSCRTHIYQDRTFKGLDFSSTIVCDLLSEEYRLTRLERQLIGQRYLSRGEMKKIENTIEKFEFFPLLCRLYSKHKVNEIEAFFSNPDTILRNDLKSFMQAQDQKTIAILTLFIAYNNNLHNDVLSPASGIKQKIEVISDNFHLQTHLSIQVVRSELNNLRCSYVKCSKEKYSFLHDKLFDILVSFLGDHKFDLILNIAHTNIIRDSFLLESLLKPCTVLKKNENIIIVQKDKEKDFIFRLVKDFEDGYIKNVILNEHLRDKSFRKKLVQLISQSVDMEKMICTMSRNTLTTLLVFMVDQNYCDLLSIFLIESYNLNECDWEESPLCIAIKKEYTDIVKLLLDRKCDINFFKTGSQTPLYVAARKSRNGYSFVKLLLEHSAKTDIRGLFGSTPLYTATKKNNVEVVKLLLDRSANPNISNDYNNTPLHVAIAKGYYEIAMLLLEHKADFNFQDVDNKTPLFLSAENKNGVIKDFISKMSNSVNVRRQYNSALLYIACNSGDFNEVKNILLQGNINVNNNENEFLQTALYIASEKGHSDIVSLLFDHQCDANISNKNKDLPLHAAAQKGHTKVVEFLVTYNANDLNNNDNKCKKSPLYLASEQGHTKIVKLLIHYECDTNLTNECNQSALFVSSCNNHAEIIKLLLENKSDPYICNSHAQTPLHAALSNDHTHILNLLLEYGVDPNYAPFCTTTPLCLAVAEGKTNTAKLLLNYRADPNIVNKNNETSLHVAATRGYIDIVKLLLTNSANPDIRDNHGKTALHIATEKGYSKIITLLLLFQANPYLHDMYNKTPFFISVEKDIDVILNIILKTLPKVNVRQTYVSMCLYKASKCGDLQKVKLLFKQNTDIDFDYSDNECKQTALYIASKRGHSDIVSFLLDLKCDPNIANMYNETPLYIAHCNGYTAIVKALLKMNSFFFEKSNRTSLYMASSEGHTDIVKSLLKYNIDVNSTDNEYKQSALYVASKNGYIDIVALLIHNGGDINLTNKYCQTPLYIASSMGHTGVVKLLLVNNCDPNICSVYDQTSLHVAAYRGHIDIVKLLLQYNCDPNICDMYNQNPIHGASYEGHTEIIKLLIEHNCSPNILNKYEQTPLDVAINNRHETVVEILLENI